MKIIFYIIFFIISFLIGIVFTIATIPNIGTLDIDTRNDAKDVLMFNFKTPPEDLVYDTKKKLIMFTINRK